MSRSPGAADDSDRPRRSRRTLWGCLAAGAAAIVALAALAILSTQQLGAPAGGRYLVKNNSSAALLCRTDRLGGWGPEFALAPGAEFSEHGSGPLLFSCGSPMKPVAYGLEPGQRYSILRVGEDRVELRRIATP